MDPLWAKAAVVAGSLGLLLLPAAAHRGRPARVARSRKGPRERILLALMGAGFLLPLAWAATPLLRFADYPLRGASFAAGVVLLGPGLWLLFRSHKDLGAGWSVTLEVREGHRLSTGGVYRHVRHPMYLALLLYGAGQALVVPNAVAGPAYLVAVVLLVAFRLRPEERMMREEFGEEYEAYAARTKRLVPGLW